MKKLLISYVLFGLLLASFPFVLPSFAQQNCQPVYGGGETCMTKAETGTVIAPPAKVTKTPETGLDIKMLFSLLFITTTGLYFVYQAKQTISFLD